MHKILLTGASGNVGKAIRRHFRPDGRAELLFTARERQPSQDGQVYFDFEDPAGTTESLKKADVLFLLRPPQLSDVKRYFAPLIRACVANRVQHIVFLSVQGADKSSFIPHAKIERLILESGIPYTFLRPSYFMQNLTTTLLEEIKRRRRIFLPAGNARFLWVDVEDIGKAAARILNEPGKHRNTAYTITGKQLISFPTAAKMLTETIGENIEFISPNPLRFFFEKRKEKIPLPYILVMVMLHFLPRFQNEQEISSDFEALTGDTPNTLDHFIAANREVWL